jgi:hypothetical protein
MTAGMMIFQSDRSDAVSLQEPNRAIHAFGARGSSMSKRDGRTQSFTASATWRGLKRHYLVCLSAVSLWLPAKDFC